MNRGQKIDQEKTRDSWYNTPLRVWHTGQLQRMKLLAETALAAYDLEHVSGVSQKISARALSEEHEALIDTFIGGRLMCHVFWLTAYVEEPPYGQRATRRIALETREIKDLLHDTRPPCDAYQATQKEPLL